MAKNIMNSILKEEEDDEPFDLDAHIKALTVKPSIQSSRSTFNFPTLPENEFDWETNNDLPQTD